MTDPNSDSPDEHLSSSQAFDADGGTSSPAGDDGFLSDCMSELQGRSNRPEDPSTPEERSRPAEDLVSDLVEHQDVPESQESDAASPALVPELALTRSESKSSEIRALHLATSTFLSLLMVLVVLLLARVLVPPLVESTRYSWYRGQLRAEYELSGQRLKSVSLDSLADVSQLVSQRMGPSVVHINLLREMGNLSAQDRIFARNNPMVLYEGQGSGFVIGADGLILTNYHVLEDGGDIEVSLADGRRFRGVIVGADPATDLAVIKVDAEDLMPVEWGDSDQVEVGTPVWAVGSPFGLQQTVTFGIISGKHRVDFRSTRAGRVNAGTPYGDLMQSDVALNPGNSGGPLVNAMGQVVGVNAAILGDTFQGVSFSIPSQVAQRVSQYLIEEGEVPRGWLGVELSDLDPSGIGEKEEPEQGVFIRRFPPQLASPAKRAGLKVGDQILRFEGSKVASTAGLIRMIGESEVGATVTLTIKRDGEELDFEVPLDRRLDSTLPR